MAVKSCATGWPPGIPVTDDILPIRQCLRSCRGDNRDGGYRPDHPGCRVPARPAGIRCRSRIRVPVIRCAPGQRFGLPEDVAFGGLDSRLARQLRDHCGPDQVVRAAHPARATDPGSTREVISRLLKEVEAQGRLELQRGSILMPDRKALEVLAAR
jgi:hypothetical protein